MDTFQFPNDNWTRVEIFLRAEGRLPEHIGDVITAETLRKFCENYESGKAKSSVTDLKPIYEAIKAGKVLLSEDMSNTSTAMDTSKITRVEVINHRPDALEGGGREFVSWMEDNQVDVHIQDEGRTMKVIISKRK
jgi:hypothetical protein